MFSPETGEPATHGDSSTCSDFETAVAALQGKGDEPSRFWVLFFAGEKMFQPHTDFLPRWALEKPPAEPEPRGVKAQEYGPHVAPSMRDAVYDPARTLAIGVGDADWAERLAESGIAALMFDAMRGNPPHFLPGIGGVLRDVPTAPLHYSGEGNYYLTRALFGYGLEGRRVVVLAPPYAGPRDSNPVHILADKLRAEGARVTVVPEADDAVEAIKGAANNFGSFRRTTGGGGKH